jgi:hypothetical protein
MHVAAEQKQNHAPSPAKHPIQVLSSPTQYRPYQSRLNEGTDSFFSVFKVQLAFICAAQGRYLQGTACNNLRGKKVVGFTRMGQSMDRWRYGARRT